ncbi:ankyrin repeat domain-containing protein [Planctomyces sp. SH-PL62]|uniref:ankyrin repeat domain-containing protein n=1 Tax=Planctomyces sp. SH-PL62 TaxID=1636152 RepID=UPI00078BE8F9|nr:ankyrin repeat domain-containing protein [Planctomyces sp. SH-PL62]AMV37820.1 Ankyrin repeats (3 copies) [Planctomyces sp. SH-PL62]
MLIELTKLAKQGDEVGVRRLLEQGVPAEGVDRDRLQWSLQIAAGRGHLEIVKLLLAAGADVDHADRDGFTPTTSAARAGKWRVVKLLAEQGADFSILDGYGRSGLDYLQRCRGKRNRAEIEAVLAARGSGPIQHSPASE